MADSLPPGYVEGSFTPGAESSEVPGLAPKAVRDTSVNTSILPTRAQVVDTGVPLAAGTAAGLATEGLTGSTMLGGAAGNVVQGAASRIMDRIRGRGGPETIPPEVANLPKNPLTGALLGALPATSQDVAPIAKDALIGAGAAGVGKSLSAISGIGSARKAATEAFDTATKQGENIAAEKAGVLPKLKSQFSSQVQQGLEKARPEAATSQAQAIMDRMLGKSPATAATERAAPEDVLAPKVAQAKQTYFDSLDKIRTARQAPYETAMKPIKDKPVADIGDLQKVVGDIRGTQGLNIRSTELKNAFDRIENAGGGGELEVQAERAGGKVAKGGKFNLTPEQFAQVNAARSAEGAGTEKDLTYGELWRLRNDAWRTIRSSSDPEERAAAHQFTDEVDNIFDKAAPVAQADKDRYALYKSGFTPKLTRDIAKARTPGEVGKAIFSQPESVTLQVIDQAKKSPQALEHLRGSFTDAIREQGLPADKVVARTNPAVLRGLYGADAEPLIKLGGSDMNVKGANWARMIQSSPEGRQAFRQTMSEVMDKEGMREAQDALREGTQAVGILPKEQQEAVNKAVAKAGTIQQKLAILQKALPDPKSAAMDALKQGPGYNHWQRWALHHGAFMALGALAGGQGYMSGNKPLEYAGLSMFLMPLATQTLLKNPTLAKGFVNALDLPPTRFGLKKMATSVARMTATQAIAGVGDALSSNEPQQQPEPETAKKYSRAGERARALETP